ncbi:ankycorbin isoform X2 [Hyperolius riggenbachi]|uniref:ankycorbin isoform X2 n=1 Tax=Hyperolius riggenbachi TaxID=752182 RepID=UPI0035A3344A
MKSLKAKFRKSDTNEWSKNDDRLLQAVDHGEVDKVPALLGKKGVSATKLDSEGKTAFHVAAAKGNVDCLRLMLSHGADVCAQDLSGHTALHLSVKHNHLECIKRLLQSKCPTEFVDASGWTPVHYAAANGAIPVLQLLCENKCNLSVKDQDGNSPLLIAVQHGHIETCKCLLDHKADINVTDKNGKSPLMLACETGQFNIVDLLVQRGANLTLTDALGHDALHYARISGNPHTLTLLLSRTSQESGPRSPNKPSQMGDVSSNLSSTSTPLSAKGEVFFPEQGAKDENTPCRRDYRDRLSDSTGEDSLLDVSSEVEHADTLSLLQAKVASLTLLNKELQDKLQEKANAETVTDISCDSYHSTQADLSFAKDREEKSSAVISDNSDISFESQPEVTKYEWKVRQLEQTIEEMQVKLEESETIRKNLEAQVQLVSSSGHAATESSEASPETDVQSQGSLDEQNEVTLKPNLQRMSKVDPELEEEGIVRSNDDNTMVLEEFESLKKEYQEVLAESERKENEMNDLRHQIDAVTQSIVNLVPIERQEEMEKSYCAVIEKLNVENGELNKKQEELLGEIKSLRKELERQKESLTLENGHEEDDRSTAIDELTRQVSELSLLYSEAQAELEKTRQASNAISSDFIHKDEHMKLLQEVEESKEKVETDLVDLASQHARILEELCELKQQMDNKREDTPESELEKVVSGLKKQIENLKVDKNGLMGQLASQETKIKSLEDELQQEKVTVQESSVTKRLLAEWQVSLEDEISTLSSQIADLLKDKEQFSVENGQAQREITQLKEEKEVFEGQLTLKEQENNELYMKFEKLQEDLLEMKRLTDSTSKVDEDKDKKISELNKEVSKLKEALNSLSQLSFTTSTPKRQTQQLEALQQQVKQLQNQLVETKKQHQEIVSVYRMHLLYAVQGQMDEDVQKMLKQILSMCKNQSQKI